jgi:gliding motility-associated-like protein
MLDSDQYEYSDYDPTIDGGLITLRDHSGNTIVWKHAYTAGDCPLDLWSQTSEALGFSMFTEPLRSSFSDSLWHGSYQLPSFDLTSEASTICEPPFIPYNLLPDDVSKCAGEFVDLDIREVEQPIFWSDGDSNKLKSISVPGLYSYAYAICDDIYEETIDVLDETCTCRLYIPNAFSPNFDGVNDYFQVYGNCTNPPSFSMQVYNRWGQRVFDTDRRDFQWDGTYEGRRLELDTYTYVMEYEDPFGLVEGKIHKKGVVLIVL